MHGAKWQLLALPAASTDALASPRCPQCRSRSVLSRRALGAHLLVFCSSLFLALEQRGR